MSAIEAFTNASVGLVVSWLLTLHALPFWGYTRQPRLFKEPVAKPKQEAFL